MNILTEKRSLRKPWNPLL